MRRLYLQIYAALLAILLVFAVLVGVAWLWLSPGPGERRAIEGLAGLAAEHLPPSGAPSAALEEAARDLARRTDTDVTVLAPDGALLASVGRPLAAPEGRERSGWVRGRHGGPALALHLPDGRWLVARPRHGLGGRGVEALLTLALLGLAVALGAYPVARRLAGRLERLRGGVEELGRGALGARVEVEGRDEVAALARSFNAAAERIERLVEAQRGLLLGASHELRTPLARLRVAVELMAADTRPELRAEVAREIAELDALIEELLLASRLQAADALEQREDVDLLALVAEEAARTGADAQGDPVLLAGDARLLRRLVRNLLENARRHGGGEVEARVERLEGGGAWLTVSDRGPGVPEEERERIFAPFYRRGREGGPDGMGLGLTLVRQIARRHGGEVVCAPREGGGTRFEVTLPAPPPNPRS